MKITRRKNSQELVIDVIEGSEGIKVKDNNQVSDFTKDIGIIYLDGNGDSLDVCNGRRVGLKN